VFRVTRHSAMRQQSQSGFSLVEVLVATLTISVSLLGFAGLQITSLKTTQKNNLRSKATILVYDMADRIRMNWEVKDQYFDIETGSSGPPQLQPRQPPHQAASNGGDDDGDTDDGGDDDTSPGSSNSGNSCNIPPCGRCAQKRCFPEELAGWERETWDDLVEDVLPDGLGQIVSGDGDAVSVSVCWKQKTEVVGTQADYFNPPTVCELAQSADDQYAFVSVRVNGP
jgi:type II secretory pathway pseudopilin PulG